MDFTNVLIIALVSVAIGYLAGLMISNMRREQEPKPSPETDPAASYAVPADLSYLQVARLVRQMLHGPLILHLDGRYYRSPEEMSPELLARMEELSSELHGWLGYPSPVGMEYAPALAEELSYQAQPASEDGLAGLRSSWAQVEVAEQPPVLDSQDHTEPAAALEPSAFTEEPAAPEPPASAFTEQLATAEPPALLGLEEAAQPQGLPAEPAQAFVPQASPFLEQVENYSPPVRTPGKTGPLEFVLPQPVVPVRITPLSIVEQIDAILQENIAGTEYAERGIRLIEMPNSGVAVRLGLEVFQLDAIPEAEVRALIRRAVAEWEQLAK